jgi:hypothetical protein
LIVWSRTVKFQALRAVDQPTRVQGRGLTRYLIKTCVEGPVPKIVSSFVVS